MARSVALHALTLSGCALALLAAAVAPVEAAAAAGERYVALGDSYASGAGARDYYQDSGDCNRSPWAYAPVLAARFGLDLVFPACLGATTRSLLSTQISQVTAAARYVTVSIGGNDALFSHVLTQCAKPWPYNCNDDIDRAEGIIRTELPGRLDEVYRQIRSRAPQARVLVIGPPRLFMRRTCNLGTRINVKEQDRLNVAADRLAEVTRERVRVAGARFLFVDPRTAFAEHGVCAEDEWINGLSRPVKDSFHPNAKGYRALADQIGSVLR